MPPATEKQSREWGVMVQLMRLVIVAVFAIGSWQGYVHFSLNQHEKALVKDAEWKAEMSEWREEMVEVWARQTVILEFHQVAITDLQHKDH